jgi:hypothetical protein
MVATFSKKRLGEGQRWDSIAHDTHTPVIVQCPETFPILVLVLVLGEGEWAGKR